jgi:peroxiredoxin
MKKVTMLAITALLTMVLLTSGCTSDDNGDEEEEEELETAPTFTLESTDNETVRLSSYLGKVVVLDFMFIDCTPCKEEMPHLEDVYDNYDDNDVVIISIDTQVEMETKEELRAFKEENGYEWIFCMDTKNVGEGDYGTSSYPTLFIINREGKIAYEKVGKTPYSTLSAEINVLL